MGFVGRLYELVIKTCFNTRFDWLVWFFRDCAVNQSSSSAYHRASAHACLPENCIQNRSHAEGATHDMQGSKIICDSIYIYPVQNLGLLPVSMQEAVYMMIRLDRYIFIHTHIFIYIAFLAQSVVRDCWLLPWPGSRFGTLCGGCTMWGPRRLGKKYTGKHEWKQSNHWRFSL